jgi:hypothetical protein
MVVNVVSHKGSLWKSVSIQHATNRLVRLRLPQPQTSPPANAGAGAGAISTAADRHEISFRLTGHRGEVACAITREAPEVPFWLPPDADQIRLLKAFADGRRRIIAVAGRKVRLRPGEPVQVHHQRCPDQPVGGGELWLPSVTRHHQSIRCFSSVSRCRRSSST